MGRFFNISLLFFTLVISGLPVLSQSEKDRRFDIEEDLLLAQFDCKTDVDDLHSVAAFVTLMSHARYSDVKYHGVAGTYGVQEGLYVPAEALFQRAFGTNWSDAHSNFKLALDNVKQIAVNTLEAGGDIWIAEAGQSDFSAALVRALQKDLPDLNTAERVNVVQHSNWNEEVTTADDLEFVKSETRYHKIPDGNATANGSPGFRTPGYTQWRDAVKDPHLRSVWELAVELGLKYNGVEGRYNNEAVAADGLDFSDLSESCYILGLEDIADTAEFFERFGY